MKKYDNKIEEYTLVHGDYTLKFLNLGAIITEYSYKGQNIVLKFEDYNAYLDNSTYMGSIIGRTAGRIRDAKIGDWQIPINFNNKHNLHGNDLHLKYYTVQSQEDSALLTLDDKEGAFPGNANIKVEYKLGAYGLEQTISAISDTPTVFNMTNHTYFNLDNTKSILDHKLKIDSKIVGELDADLLPIGNLEVKNTPFDFQDSKFIREAYEQKHSQFEYSKFIDHPFKLDGSVILESEKLKLEITTDQDYVVVYCGNYLGGETQPLVNNMNKDYNAICLETQMRPNTIDLVTKYSAKTKYKLIENK